MKKLLLCYVVAIFCITNLNAQTVSTFMETDTNGCYGLTIDENFLYVISSFDGKVHRKGLTSTDPTYETFDIGGSGYNGICKVGDYVYISKPANGSPGIYRFNINEENSSPENFLSLNSVYGITYRGSELYISSDNKIYKIDLNSSPVSLIQIDENIAGTAGFHGETVGLKIYENYLYVSESTGISKINLDSGNYEKETITTYTGTSFAKGNGNIFYLTGGEVNNAIYELDVQTQTYGLLVEIDNFIGTYDIVFKDNSLFVTTQEGDYNEVAKINLGELGIGNIKTENSYMFPNPADDYINLTGIEPGENIAIITPNGQVVKTLKTENNKIDISGLKAGNYFIKYRNSYNRFIKK